jgi:hypothetical protein
MKHKVIINVTDERGNKTEVLRGAQMWLPRKIVEWLFGEYTQVYLLKPNQTIESVDIREITERRSL